MIDQLKDNLAKGRNLRKKDFNLMIRTVMEDWQERGEIVESRFNIFRRQEEEMIQRLRRIIENRGGSKTEDLEQIKHDILQRQKDREKEIIGTLKKYQLMQEELKFFLERLIAKKRSIAIKDFKHMIKLFRSQQSEQSIELGRLQDDFEIIRDKVQEQWKSVFCSVSNR